MEYTWPRVFVRSNAYVPCSDQAWDHLASKPSNTGFSGTLLMVVKSMGSRTGAANPGRYGSYGVRAVAWASAVWIALRCPCSLPAPAGVAALSCGGLSAAP